MSKATSDHLYLLIRSLSKSEKRAFMLYAERHQNGKGRKFVRLFRAFAKQKAHNEQKILDRHKDFDPTQLPNMKAHLYKEVLSALRLLNSNRSGDMYLASLIDNARILYDKCLYKDCIRMLDKAKMFAELHRKPVMLLEILNFEKRVARQTIAGKNEARVNSVIRQTEAVSESIRHINIFSNLAFSLNAYYVKKGFVRNEDGLKEVSTFFQNSLPHYNISKLTFHEKTHLYQAFTGYYFFIQDFRKGLEYSIKWVTLFDENPDMIRDLPELYIRSLNSLLVGQSKLFRKEDFQHSFRKLVSLKKRKDIRKTGHIMMILQKAIYVHEINRHYLNGTFTEGTRIVNRLKSELVTVLPVLDKHSVLLFYYKIACLYFGSDNHKEAVKWLNLIIHSKEGDVREDLHEFARILALISNFELGNEEMIENQVKSLYRFLLRKGSLSRFEQLILRFLRRLSGVQTEKRLKPLFTELKTNMEKLEHQRFERRAFLYFDIISWLKSKIEKRPVQDILLEKAVAGK